ncbi:hypothetical protein [Sutcliffiella deserti]|uniref:hypothetical protein n=1 Tax=Sutcliffiella deserti TaxID=2875501 RepID=UPI001CC082C5|nr:hypothetical protein [Sutcliffiella deserti]
MQYLEVEGAVFIKYLRFNLVLLPLYLFFCMALILGIVLAAEKETYFKDMFLFVLPQYWVLLAIPNFIYLFLKRKEEGNTLGFLKLFILIPIPFIFITVLMRIIYV